MDNAQVPGTGSLWGVGLRQVLGGYQGVFCAVFGHFALPQINRFGLPRG